MEKEQNRVGLLEADASDFQAFDELHSDLSRDAVSPDEVEDVLQKLERTIQTEADPGEGGLAASATAGEDDGLLDEARALDLSAGEMEQGPDPVRLYLR